MVPTEEITEDYTYRVEQYEEMGFTLEEATKLAEAKDEMGFTVWPGYVKQAIAKGCTHPMALRIWA